MVKDKEEEMFLDKLRPLVVKMNPFLVPKVVFLNRYIFYIFNNKTKDVLFSIETDDILKDF